MDAANTPAAGNARVPVQSSQRDLQFELYKLEYERAAIRYEDIYKAVWQIFSYMTAVSGALLAFGGDRFQENLFWFLASAPLVYWFLGTYIPLNTYGANIGARLSAIEEQLNSDYGVNLSQYRSFEQRTTRGGRKHLRVRHVVFPVFWALTIFLIYQGVRTGSALVTGTSLIRERGTEVKIVTIDTVELQRLIEGAKSINQTPAIPPKDAPAKREMN
jgi:hypothetical protein